MENDCFLVEMAPTKMMLPKLCLHHQWLGVRLLHQRKKNSEGSTSRSCAIGTTLGGMYDVQKRDDTNDAIGKFLFYNRIPFHVARSAYYKEMVQSIAAIGTSYVPPGEHKLRTTVLERKVSKINVQKEESRQT